VSPPNTACGVESGKADANSVEVAFNPGGRHEGPCGRVADSTTIVAIAAASRLRVGNCGPALAAPSIISTNAARSPEVSRPSVGFETL